MNVREGDKVLVEETGEDDCTITAWRSIKAAPYGVVKQVIGQASNPAGQMYAIDFGAPFAGGIDCQGVCGWRAGQYVMSKNVSLCFEASREVRTVPNIEVL